MKKSVLLFFAVAMLVPCSMSAQNGKYGADSVECVKNLSYYTEYYKQKNYEDALINWRKAYHYCPPTCSQNLLIQGTTLLKLAAGKVSGEARKAVADSIMTLQDQRAQYYPRYEVTALNNKGQYIANYFRDDPEKAHGLYREIISKLGSSVKGSVVENDFRSVIELFTAGKLSAEEVINTYTENMNIFDGLTAKNEVEEASNSQSRRNVENLFISSKVASCDEVVKLFTPRLAADPENINLIKNIVSMLNATEDCTSNDLYLNAVVAMDRIEPSSGSAYALYRMNAARGNKADAVKYLEKALEFPDLSSDKKAEYTTELARMAMSAGNLSKAYECASKMVAMGGTSTGEGYLIMGKIWGASRCGGDEITRRAPYWVAVDYLSRAKAADPSLSAEANRLIGQYSSYFPTAADAFMYNLSAGQSYTVSCGGRTATTTVKVNR